MPDWKEEITRRLASLKLAPAREAEIVEEVAQHLEDRYQELLAGGATEGEARRMALEELSDEDLLARGLRRVEQEVTQEPVVPGGEGRYNFLASPLQDLRYGLRMLRKNPAFTIVAVLTVALGIAVNTTIFSAVSGLLLKKPAVKDPDSLVTVSSKNIVRGWDLLGNSAPDFESWRSQNHVFQDMAAVASGHTFTLTGRGEPESVEGDEVSPSHFNVIGIRPVLGRAFFPSEGKAGNDHVVILSNALWQRRFGSDPNAVGEKIEIDHEPYSIVGVMPREASIPMPWTPPSLWVPLVFSAKNLSPSARGDRYLSMVLGRLKSGVMPGAAQAEMGSIARRLSVVYPETNKDCQVTVLTLQEFLIRKPQVRTALMMLMVIVGLVLLIACLNIAGLLLARGTARAHEMVVRAALGASRRHLIRQMLLESLLLGLAGGGAGLVMSFWGIRLLRAGFNFNEIGQRMAEHIHLDLRTLLFTVVLSLVTAVVFGLLPAIRASQTDPGSALSESARTGSGSLSRTRLRGALVSGQIALALALLAGAGLLMRDLGHDFSMEKGFSPDHLLLSMVTLKSHWYEKPGAQMVFFQQVTENLRRVPGVESAAATTGVPLTGLWSGPFNIVGQPPLPEPKRPKAQGFVVGAGYFGTMRIPLLRGRDFSDADDSHAQGVAIVNREFARQFFPGVEAIGKQIELDDNPHHPLEIVGIVGNVPAYLGATPNPQTYRSSLQVPSPVMMLALRSYLPTSTIAPALRQAVWAVDEEQAIGRIMTMKEVMDLNTGGSKFIVGLMGIFGGFALALAAVGIYGVTTSAVNQRTRELGIRLALGAQKTDILGLVLRQGGVLTGIGCAGGLALALPLPRLLTALFPDFQTHGPAVVVGATLIIAMVSLLATYIPARRATMVDPMVALRHE